MGTVRYSCPISLVPTYILSAIEIRYWFHPDSLKSERLVYVETGRRTNGRKDGHDQIEYKLNGVGNDSFTALQTSD